MTRQEPINVNSDSVSSSPYLGITLPSVRHRRNRSLEECWVIAVHTGPGTRDRPALHSMPVGAAHFLVNEPALTCHDHPKPIAQHRTAFPRPRVQYAHSRRGDEQQGREASGPGSGPSHCWASQDAFLSGSQTVTGTRTGVQADLGWGFLSVSRWCRKSPAPWPASLLKSPTSTKQC